MASALAISCACPSEASVRPRAQLAPRSSQALSCRRTSGPSRHGSSRHSRARVLQRRTPVTRAMQADDLPPPAEMSYENALELLGVSEGASFDDILRAKKRRLDVVGENPELALRVEAAYDILLMQSLSRRRAGKVVDSSVKFADVRKPKPPSAPPAWVTAVSRTTRLSLAKPPSQEIATKAAVFGALAAWTYVGGLGSEGDALSQYGGAAQSGADVPGLQLSLALGASIYFLRKENVGLGKAAALSFAALTFGGLFGGFLESWLRVDIFPLLGVSSPAVLIGEFSTVFLALACIFLR